MHLIGMDTNLDDFTLIAAARRREPGALRALAVTLDGRLTEDDAALDGAVAAWQALGDDGSRGVLRETWSLLTSFRRLTAHRVPVSPPREMTQVSRPEPARVLHHRPAA